MCTCFTPHDYAGGREGEGGSRAHLKALVILAQCASLFCSYQSIFHCHSSSYLCPNPCLENDIETLTLELMGMAARDVIEGYEGGFMASVTDMHRDYY